MDWAARSDGLNATFLRVRNVDARPGAEVFVHEGHITTEELAGVYTVDGGALRRAGELAFGGADAGIRFGFTCHADAPARIVQHEFDERTPFRGQWTRTDTTYRWVGARLQRGARHQAHVKPTAAEVGVHC